MALITHSTRFPARALALAGMVVFTGIGFAGARNTIVHLNEQKGGELARAGDAAAREQRAIAAIKAKELELQGQAKLAESASELGARTANCGSDTLSEFYFQPGMDVVTALSAWGMDWYAPRYNSDKWYRLFDSSGFLFAAIRGGSEVGKPEIVTVDQQELDQASICNLNMLSQE